MFLAAKHWLASLEDGLVLAQDFSSVKGGSHFRTKGGFVNQLTTLGGRFDVENSIQAQVKSVRRSQNFRVVRVMFSSDCVKNLEHFQFNDDSVLTFCDNTFNHSIWTPDNPYCLERSKIPTRFPLLKLAPLQHIKLLGSQHGQAELLPRNPCPVVFSSWKWSCLYCLFVWWGHVYIRDT